MHAPTRTLAKARTTPTHAALPPICLVAAPVNVAIGDAVTMAEPVPDGSPPVAVVAGNGTTVPALAVASTREEVDDRVLEGGATRMSVGTEAVSRLRLMSGKGMAEVCCGAGSVRATRGRSLAVAWVAVRVRMMTRVEVLVVVIASSAWGRAETRSGRRRIGVTVVRCMM